MKATQQQIAALFQQAVALSDPCQRRACLEAAFAGDTESQQEVESLIAAYERAGSFLKTPATLDSRWLPPEAKRSFGDYELLEIVARGGMGVVYKARQASLNRVVALKMILAGQLASEAEVKRFRTEALAAASLSHPNIVGIYEVGEHEGQRYYTMPFVESRSLSQLVDSGQWTPGDGVEAARLVAKLAHAIDYAHQAGILHRDLKPGNILIDANGEPHLADFGLAKRVKGEEHLTLTGDLLGTPAFMAPEQARGKSADATTSTDIYSLGAVLYYLLTGRPPFVAESPLDALLLVLEAEAVKPRRINPHVPGPLEGICLRCLEKRPEDRYPSAGALAQDLERFLKGEPLAINQKAIGRQFETWARRQPALAARVCTVVLCLVIIILAFWLHNYESDAQFRAAICLLLLWLWLSALCQRGLDIDRHAFWVRFVWSGLDPAVLTALLLTAQGFNGPLLILFPTLIAASGFWGRVSLVATTTATSLLGYILLLWDSTRGFSLAVQWLSADPASLRTRAHFIPLHWHWLALVAILVSGISVAYLVNRVSALTQFYERRPQS